MGTIGFMRKVWNLILLNPKRLERKKKKNVSISAGLVVPNAKKPKIVISSKVGLMNDSKTEIPSEVEDMDDDRSVVSSRDGATNQVLEEKVIHTKISDAKKAKLDNSKKKSTKTFQLNLLWFWKS